MSKNTETVKRRLHPIPEAARSLGIGRSSLYRLLERGEVASVRVGGRRLVAADELDAYVAKLRNGGAR